MSDVTITVTAPKAEAGFFSTISWALRGKASRVLIGIPRANSVEYKFVKAGRKAPIKVEIRTEYTQDLGSNRDKKREELRRFITDQPNCTGEIEITLELTDPKPSVR